MCSMDLGYMRNCTFTNISPPLIIQIDNGQCTGSRYVQPPNKKPVENKSDAKQRKTQLPCIMPALGRQSNAACLQQRGIGPGSMGRDRQGIGEAS